MGKAQIAMEFILMLALVLVFTTLIAGAAYYYVVDYSEQRNVKKLQDLGYSLQDEVILAHTVDVGYQRTITIPSMIDSVQVHVSGTPNDIVITYKGSELLFRIPPTIGAFTNGANNITHLQNGSVKIN